MTFSCLSEAEVREKYRRAENKEEMVVVLAGLTNAKMEEVRHFLGIGPPPKKNQKARVNIDSEEAKRLHGLGFSDADIAERLHVTKSTVRRWRYKNGLDFNAKSAESSDNRMELYNQGLNDKEIGELCGLSHSGVQNWRVKNGLPPNAKQGGDNRKTGGKKR